MVEIRTAYDPSVDEGVLFIDRFGELEISRTVQSEKDNCDINILMDRYQKSGVIPVMQGAPIYGDFTELPDYRGAVETVMKADKAFSSLPAKVRAEFDNDPARFLEFAQDPVNEARMRDMGLLPPVEVVPPSNASSEAVEPPKV